MSLTISTPAEATPALIVPKIATVDITLTEASLAQKRDTVELLQDIVSVKSITDRDDALAAAGLAKGTLKSFEESKTALKEPALRICQQIDKLAKGYSDSIKAELTRVERLLTQWQTEADRKADELRQAELREIAQAAAIEAAQNNVEKLREYAMREAELNQPTRVEGAMRCETWEFEPLDEEGLLRLAIARPDLVTIEPKTRDIRAAIAAGALLPGLRVWKVSKLHSKAS